MLGSRHEFGKLKSIGRNIADSLASGICLLIGYYQIDVFAEAANGPEGYIRVDFLAGKTSGSPVSPSLAKAIELYTKNALPDLCRRHGVPVDAFRQLLVRYTTSSIRPQFAVTVVDRAGKSETDTFFGVPGRRALTMDHLGRLRRKPSVRMTVVSGGHKL